MRTLGHPLPCLCWAAALPGPPGSLACCWSPVAPPAVAAGQAARWAGWPRLAPPECDGCNNSDTVRERCCDVNTIQDIKVLPPQHHQYPPHPVTLTPHS